MSCCFFRPKTPSGDVLRVLRSLTDVQWCSSVLFLWAAGEAHEGSLPFSGTLLNTAAVGRADGVAAGPGNQCTAYLQCTNSRGQAGRQCPVRLNGNRARRQRAGQF